MTRHILLTIFIAWTWVANAYNAPSEKKNAIVRLYDTLVVRQDSNNEVVGEFEFEPV